MIRWIVKWWGRRKYAAVKRAEEMRMRRFHGFIAAILEVRPRLLRAGTRDYDEFKAACREAFDKIDPPAGKLP